MRHRKHGLAVTLVFALTACADHAKPSVALYEAGDYAGAARAADDGLAHYPGDRTLAGMRVRAALALGDGDGVAKAYAGLQHASGDDKQLLRDLAIATLGQALGSPSVRLKIEAIQAIQDLEIQALADRVADRLGDDDDRVAAAAAIAVLRGYAQAPQVASDMLKSERPEARRIAVDGIGKKVGKLAIADIEAAASDPDPRVRAVAIRWLGTLVDRDAPTMLAERLRDRDPDVRAAAGRALAHIGAAGPGAADELLADKELGVRLAGLELLKASHRDDRIAQLASDPDPRVALEAVAAAPGLLASQAATVVERARADKAWATRAAVANLAPAALGQLAATPIEQQLAHDDDPHVRLAAGRALAHLGDRADAVATWTALLTDHDVKLDAAEELAALGVPAGTAALAAAVRDLKATPDERASAASLHRDAHLVTPELVAALANPNGVVRVAVATALGAFAR